MAAFDSFDDRYLGQKSSNPSTDNDGNALVAGTLYFNTTTGEMKVYDGSAWLNAYASLSGALIATSNLSDLNNAGTARTNLGLGSAATTDASAYATAAQADQTVSLTGAGATSISGIYPTFTITSTDTDTTYSVGDGGLTQNNFTDALKTKLDGVATNANNYTLPFTDNSANWNTAFGWGNHAHAGYLTSHQDISGKLDATATAVEASALDIVDTRNDGARAPNDYADHRVTAEFTDDINGTWWSSLTVKGWHDGYAPWQLVGYAGTGQNENLYVRFGHGSNNAWSSLRQIWHAGNDGTGSGLDADTVDGVQASSFLRSDAADSTSGTLTCSNGLKVTGGAGTIAGATFANGWFQLGSSSQGLTIDTNEMYTSGSGDFNFGALGTGKWKFITRPRFTNGIDFGDSSPVVDENGNYLRITTSSGYTDIGSGNSSYSHFYTDRGKYYFNKRLTVDEGIVQSYNENLVLRRAESSSHQMTLSTSGATFTHNVTAYSDGRLKQDVKPIENALDTVEKLEGVTYTRKDNQEKNIGFIAQQIEEACPELAERVVGEMDDERKTKHVNYANMVALLVEAVKELKAEVGELKAAK